MSFFGRKVNEVTAKRMIDTFPATLLTPTTLQGIEVPTERKGQKTFLVPGTCDVLALDVYPDSIHFLLFDREDWRLWMYRQDRISKAPTGLMTLNPPAAAGCYLAASSKIMDQEQVRDILRRIEEKEKALAAGGGRADTLHPVTEKHVDKFLENWKKEGAPDGPDRKADHP